MANTDSLIVVRKKRWVTCFESAILDTDLSIYEKMVFVVLCSHAKMDGSCFPSVRKIAGEASCSRTKVFEALRVLEENGFISRENQIFDGRGQISNIYTINDIEPPASTPPGRVGAPDGPPPSGSLTPPVRLPAAINNVLEQDHINKEPIPPLTPPEGGGGEEEPFELKAEQPERSKASEAFRGEGIRKFYNQLLPELPAAEKITKSREKSIRARIREDPAREDLDWWRRYFLRVRESPYLLGHNNNNWAASLDWLLRDEPMQKVIEGAYVSHGGRTAGGESIQKNFTGEGGEIDAKALLRNINTRAGQN
jgi:predicted transcriptional regulator